MHLRSTLGAVGLLVFFVGALSSACSADREASPFEFFTWVNDYSAEDVEIWVDGERFDSSGGTQTLKTAIFDSYEEARAVGVTIETRRDGAVLETCTLRAGACANTCRSARETASVCISRDGSIEMNTWECPCDGLTVDYGCVGDCDLTKPLD